MEHELKAKVSKCMSYLLRHNPENLEMDRHGFVGLDEFVKRIKERFQVDQKFILDIVEKSDRKRFEIIGNKIRALYGHTIIVKLELKKDKLVKVLYHGTSPEAASRILEVGLKSMRRKWVHLSPTIEIAKDVGLRRTQKPVILEIDAEVARKNGVGFYKASEMVYLCRDLSPEYIKLAETS
jgi:putative RNA 2'-phosphotransferase